MPLAPKSSKSDATLSETYNETVLDLYTNDKKHAGYLALCGQFRNDPLNNGSNNLLALETVAIYITKDKSLDKDKILGSLCYNITYIQDSLADSISYASYNSTSLATSTSGRYDGKMVKVKDEVINEKAGKYKLTLEYKLDF